MENLKNLLIKVLTPAGKKGILFTRMDPDVERGGDLVCLKCPYNGTCEHLRDPRDPSNPDKTFLDFCSSIDNESLEEQIELEYPIHLYHPVSGSIEKALGKDYPDLVKELIKEDPLIRLSEVIDGVCRDWCDMYTEDRCNCCSSNSSCIIKSLFNKKRKDNE